MKQKLILLAAVILLICLLAMPVSAETIQEGDWEYCIENGSATVVHYLGQEKDVVIPDNLGGCEVGVIGNTAFSGNTNIVSVTFPASVHKIADGWIDMAPYPYVPYGAFAGCSNLQSISFSAGSKLSYIGEWSFFDCVRLSDVSLPGSIRELALSCFEDCTGLKQIVLPEGLTTVRQNAFSGAGIESLHIPASCRDFDIWNTMPKLKSITVAQGNDYYRSDGGVLYTSRHFFGNGSGWSLVIYPIQKPEAEYRVPDFCENVYGANFASSYGVPALKKLYIGKCKGAGDLGNYDSLSRIACDVIPDHDNPYYQYVNGLLLSKDGTKLVQVSQVNNPRVTVPKTVQLVEQYAFGENDHLESVYFTGNAPEFDESTFWYSSCTVFYPKNNPTWTAEYFQAHTQYYWGSIKWSGYLLDAEGLICVDGVWGYYEHNMLKTDYTGFAEYNGQYFYVVDGILDFTYTGLGYFEGEWRYVANSLLTEEFTGLAYYNNTWFYIQNSRIPWTYTGMVEYEGNRFYVQNNELDWSYTGLGYHDGEWYFIQNALMKQDYVGLVNFEGKWFYVENGHLTWDYTGMVEYNGNWFYVQNNELDWGYTGLGYHNGGWYFIQNALMLREYSGLVNFNNTWFYITNGELDWNTCGLRRHEANLFFIKNGEVDWSYTGKATYDGVEYDVVNGLAVQ